MFDVDAVGKELSLGIDKEETFDHEEENTGGNRLEENSQAEKRIQPRWKDLSTKRILTVIVGVLVVILSAMALLSNANFVLAGGVYPRDVQTLDLREKNISLKNYEKLSRSMPDCDIRWCVPIGGGRYDSQSESLTISNLVSEEVVLFSYFPRLTSLNITDAELSVEEYRVLAAALPGCYIRWSIPIGGSRYDSAAAEIAVSDFTAEEVERFALFDGLDTVDANGCRCYDELISLQTLLPETKVLWNVEVAGTLLDQDTTNITVDGGVVDLSTLTEYLRRLPALEQVTVENCVLTAQEKSWLLATYPDVAFTWSVTLLGTLYDSSVTELSFAGRSLSAADLKNIADALPNFHSLEVLDLRGCGFTAGDFQLLYDRKPGLNIYWEIELYGQTFSTDATELDLSNITIENLAPLEEAIAWMPHLEKVIMCDCGLSNETMDKLNQRHEGIRFVWNVYLGGVPLRTDATAFFSSNFNEPNDEEFALLRYCHDMLVMDLGHRMVTDLSFVEGTPHLKYLILTNSTAADLRPLSCLKELEMLEMVDAAPVALDLTPLLECDSLVDLNICAYRHTDNGQEIADILCQMTGLERLWFCTYQLDEQQRQQVVDALPNTEIYCSNDVTSCMGGLWRYHERYYDMRDMLGMFYMDEDSNRHYLHIEDGQWVPNSEWFVTYVVGVNYPNGLTEELGLDLTYTGTPIHLKFVDGMWSVVSTGYMDGYLNRPGVA